jgi:nucleotide-binding universal stress UspA family protein
VRRWDRYQQITVAVGFDEGSERLVRAGAALARHLGKRLCLLHVVEPWIEGQNALPMGLVDPLWNAMQSVTTDARQVALGKLDALASRHAGGLNARTAVLSGKAPQLLGREAVAMGSGLLLMGVGQGTDRRVFGSTTMSLVSSSPVPIAVIGPSGPERPFEGRQTMLLADDLGPSSDGACELGLELAASLGLGEVHHAHVTGLSLEVLQSALATALAASHTPADTGTSAEAVQRQILVDVERRLGARALPHLEECQRAGCAYAAHAVVGNVAEQVAILAKEHGATVAVFGRHKVVHTDPFFLGRVPLRAMLAVGCPIIVVPRD